ncbi:MAG: S1/P1 nuclease, partial [Pseudomonadota bacterium]
MLLLAAPPLFSWGLKGHRIVARLAETRLGERAQKAVRELLGDDTLTAIANEADAYRSDSKWKCAAPFHYVSIDDGESYTSSEKNARGDMLQALVYFEDALRDSKQPAAARVLALKWLVHLIGDLHQPLHVGRSCDRGGNSTAVYWFGVKSNLHKVWDAQLINPEELSFSEYAAQLDKVAPQTAAAWSRGTYAAWAAEAPALRTQIYTCLAKDGCCAQKACKVTETVFAT